MRSGVLEYWGKGVLEMDISSQYSNAPTLHHSKGRGNMWLLPCW
jgi:hypothetical protein